VKRLRLTKICATLGPATQSRAAIERLLAAGMDLVRLNFSHGAIADHAAVVREVRAAAARLDRPIAIMQDLQGPRIRIGSIAEKVRLEPGMRVALLPRGASPGKARDLIALPYTFDTVHRDVAVGTRVLLRDGTIELRVLESAARGLVCSVERGGEVQPGCGMNFPDSTLAVPALTDRDREHMAAGIKMGVDAIALSFVRDGDDIERARRILKRRKCEALIVAKIERSAALEHLDEILDATDGVIVARGDLGVECSMEAVPLLQKDIIRRAIRGQCFVITATQMLESMIHSSMPTRAEVSDVANAVLDGSDAVMLSAETAIGKHPAAAVAMMDRIARAVEAETRVMVSPAIPPDTPPDDFIPAVAQSAVALAVQSSAAALMPFTFSGRAATTLAALRPSIPILAFTPSEAIDRQLAFYRGVLSRQLGRRNARDDMFKQGLEVAVEAGDLHDGQVVVFIGGYAMAHGAANTVKVHRVGARQIGRDGAK
jgi:pyruvate kinase